MGGRMASVPATGPVATCTRHSASARLFAEILQGDLDPIVVHLLEVGLELFAALRAAMKELDDMRNRTRRSINRFDLRRRSDVNEAVQIVITAM
jgi:hypothetical protein